MLCACSAPPTSPTSFRRSKKSCWRFSSALKSGNFAARFPVYLVVRVTCNTHPMFRYEAIFHCALKLQAPAEVLPRSLQSMMEFKNSADFRYLPPKHFFFLAPSISNHCSPLIISSAAASPSNAACPMASICSRNTIFLRLPKILALEPLFIARSGRLQLHHQASAVPKSHFWDPAARF